MGAARWQHLWWGTALPQLPCPPCCPLHPFAALQGHPEHGGGGVPDVGAAAAHHAGSAVQHQRAALPVRHAAGARAASGCCPRISWPTWPPVHRSRWASMHASHGPCSMPTFHGCQHPLAIRLMLRRPRPSTACRCCRCPARRRQLQARWRLRRLRRVSGLLSVSVDYLGRACQLAGGRSRAGRSLPLQPAAHCPCASVAHIAIASPTCH